MFDIPNPRKLDADEMGGLGSIIRNAFSTYNDLADAQNRHDLAKQQIQEALYNNEIKKAQAQYAPENEEANLAYNKLRAPNLQASTNQTRAETNRTNQLLPYDVSKARTGAEQAIEDYNQSKRINPLDVHEKQTKNAASDLDLLIHRLTMPDEIRTSHTGANQKDLDFLRSQLQLPSDVSDWNLKLKYGEKEKLADIAEKEADAKWKSTGGSRGRAGVLNSNLNTFNQQIDALYPNASEEQKAEISDAYLSGSNTTPSGIQLRPVPHQMKSIIRAINNNGINTTLQNQTANLDSLVDDFKNIDISATKPFTGVTGHLRAGTEARKAGLGLPVSDEYNDYMDYQTKVILNMDAMRKAFGTTVQPKYVKEFIGQLTDPNSSVWNNPETVATKYNALVNQLQKHADSIHKKAELGVTVRSPSSNAENPSEGKKLSRKELVARANADQNKYDIAHGVKNAVTGKQNVTYWAKDKNGKAIQVDAKGNPI